MVSSPSPFLSWNILRPCLNCCNQLWVSQSLFAPLQPSGVRQCLKSRTPLVDGHLQINELAIFGDCVGVIAWIPTALSVLLLITRYGLHPVWRRRPVWLRNFAAEEPGEADGLSADLPAKSRTWSLSTIILTFTSAVGLVISILASLNPTAGPLFLTPLIPHVSTSQTGGICFRSSADA